MFRLRYSLVLVVVLCFSGISRADTVEKEITRIRTQYNEIENARLERKTITFEPGDDPAFGEVTKFFRNGELVKARFVFGQGDHGGADETYYYAKGQMFFVYVAESSWRFTGRTMANGESETMDTLTEHRLYFSSGGLIRHLRKQVESSSYDALASLIAKAPNQPHQDPALASAAKLRGLQIPGVNSEQDIATILAY